MRGRFAHRRRLGQALGGQEPALHDRALSPARAEHPSGRPAAQPRSVIVAGVLRLPLRRVLIATLLCVTGAAAPAFAAPTWLAPASLTGEPDDAGQSQVALDGNGDAFAVWERDGLIEASVRPAGGAWGAAVPISTPATPATDPKIAVDAQGEATAIWRSGIVTSETIDSSTRPAGGEWRPPIALSASGEDEEGIALAVNSAGDAIAMWERYDGTRLVVEGDSRGAGGEWQGAKVASAKSETAEAPSVALDAAGDAVAAWIRPGGKSQVEAALRPSGGEWGAPKQLTAASGEASGLALAADPQGDAVAIWQKPDKGSEIIEASSRSAGGEWQTAVELSASPGEARHPQLALDAAGDATAVWEFGPVNGHAVQSATRPAGADGWRRPRSRAAAPATRATRSSRSIHAAMPSPTGRAAKARNRPSKRRPGRPAPDGSRRPCCSPKRACRPKPRTWRSTRKATPSRSGNATR